VTTAISKVLDFYNQKTYWLALLVDGLSAGTSHTRSRYIQIPAGTVVPSRSSELVAKARLPDSNRPAKQSHRRLIF
jgi:hypothetical protein